MAAEWKKILDEFRSVMSGTYLFSTLAQNANSQSISEESSASIARKKKYDDVISAVSSRVITRALNKKEEEDDLEEEEKNGPLKKLQEALTLDAPVAEPGEQKEGFFQAGALADKEDDKRVAKAILGSVGDVGSNLATGMSGGFEKMLLGASQFVAPFEAGFQNQNSLGLNYQFDIADYKEKQAANAELIKQGIWDEKWIGRKVFDAPLAAIGVDTTGDSVFGARSDALAQSAGQLLGSKLLGPLGNASIFLSAAGGEAKEALDNGASSDEALVSSVISGAGELLSEKMSGAIKFGGSALDDKLVESIGAVVKNRAGKFLLKLGMDAAGEGFEEIVSGAISAVGKKLTYMDDKQFKEIFSGKDALNSFVDGAVMGTIFGSFENVKETVRGNDVTTGLSNNEQKVVDKVFKNSIDAAKAENDGKVSPAQRVKLYQNAMNSVDKGYVSLETIQEAIGGDSYEKYKNVSEQAKSVSDELERLGKLEHYTLEDQSRYAELKASQQDLNKAVQDAKKQLETDTYAIAKDSRLVESYNEKARRGQAFDADLTKYDPKQRAVVQKAVESGILNNTNRTHDFVDFIAKISADKDVPFDFTNNEKLKNSGFAVEGKQVNGLVTKDGIMLNIDSAKAMNAVVGHEIMHVLKGTEHFKYLTETAYNCAIAKDGLENFNKRLKETEELYKGMDADPNEELAADLIGEYLFTDPDFISRLSTENRNVFQKIYDEIKYLCKVATAGSKEARELEKLKRAFEDAYRESGKDKTETKYSISEIVDQNQKSYGTGVHLDSTLLDNLTPDERKAMVKERIKELGGEVFTAYDNNGNAVDITIAKPSATFKNQNGKKRPVNKDLTTKYIGNEVKQEAVVLIDELIATSKFQDTDPAKHTHGWLDNNGQNDWDVWTTYIQDKNNTIWKAKLHIANTANGEKIIYDVDPTKKVGQSGNSDTSLLKNSITQNSDGVKYSISDSEGKQLTKEQQDYFKNSKAIDENGNLLVVYNGSTSRWTVPNKGGKPQWWSASKEYSDKYRGKNGIFDHKNHTVKAYINITNPLDVGNTDWFFEPSKWNAGTEKYSKQFIGIADKLGVDAESLAETANKYGNRLFNFVNTDEFINMVKDAGFDGIKANEFGETTYATFRPEQAKKTTNKHPTYDMDIRYSLSNINNAVLLGTDFFDAAQEWQNVKPQFSISEDVDSSASDSKTDGSTEYSSLSYDEITAEQGKLYELELSLRDRKQDANNNPELIKAMDEVSALFTEVRELLRKKRNGSATQAELSRIDEIKSIRDAKIAAVAEIQERIGLNEISKEEQRIKDKKEELRKAADAAWEREGALKENNAIKKSGLSAQEYFREKALKAFKTTSNFNEDGYMLPDGKMLNFSGGERNHRYRDHREIGEIYEATNGAAALNRFLNDGNIRIMAESPGIDIASGVSPTREQYAAIRRFINSHGISEGQFFVDFSDAEGRRAGHYAYTGRVNPERVLNDIKYFYETGKLRESSGLADFLSISYPDEAKKPIGDYNVYGKDIALGNGTETQTPDMEEPVRLEAPVSSEADTTFDAPLAERLELPYGAPIAEKYSAGTGTSSKVLEDHKAHWDSKSKIDIFKALDSGKNRTVAKFKAALIDKGAVFEDVALKTGNRELIGKWNQTLNSKAMAQNMIGNGNGSVKSLMSIRDEVSRRGKTEEFHDYMYHRLNIDHMTLEARGYGKNKPVFGDGTTAEMSENAVEAYEKANPEFEQLAMDVYAYNDSLRQMMVGNGVISQETADLWAEMYPNYVRIRREVAGEEMFAPLSKKNIKASPPIKQAIGGNQKILPLFDTMAQHTIQTYDAIARNNFGVELMNTLESTQMQEPVSVDDALGLFDIYEQLAQKGVGGKNPTFTVFENGERTTFEISEDMYDAFQPASGILSETIKPLNAVSNLFRNLVTVYNPTFALTNPIRDAQDVLFNSQHAAKTYAKIPEAYSQIIEGKMGGDAYWYNEYMANGGAQEQFYDTRKGSFIEKGNAVVGAVKLPLKAVETVNEVIELAPRLAEYIASREAGRSVEVSMLDAARVTTNFAAGGDVTKFLNRNGATFLNASVQGATQQVRNIREAKANGVKGIAKLVAKYVLAGAVPELLNGLLWSDDEEYEHLADYIKDGYFIVGKLSNGQFIRIPKGRTAAVVQKIVKDVMEMSNGDDLKDYETYTDKLLENFKFLMDNIGPNNPIENNIFAPIVQAMNNKTWYGEDLIPSRLEDLPPAEQYDEGTDSISIAIAEKLAGTPFEVSPIKLNYVFNQYSGAVGDILLPMLTPEAESGDDTWQGKAIAPLRDKFVVDPVLDADYQGDFFETQDWLKVNANSKNATEEDILKYRYMSSVIGDLYQQKREIQSSDLSDSEKFKKIRELQKEINSRMDKALQNYNNVSIDGVYSEVGDKRFNYSEEDETWYEIKPKMADGSDNWYYIQEKLSHDKLGMSYADFWNGKEPEGGSYYAEYNGKRYEYNPEKRQWKEITKKKADNEQKATKYLGISNEKYWNNRDGYDAVAYFTRWEENGEVHFDRRDTVKNIWGYEAFFDIASQLNSIKADKNKYGYSISGSKKKKIKEAVYSMDIPEVEKHILYKLQYNKDNSHNREILDYLKARPDISASEMREIVLELGFKVDSKGRITW